LKVGTKIKKLIGEQTGDYNNWCTSFLSPSGNKPINRLTEIEDELNDYQFEVDKWTCMYSPEMLTDGKTSTAWAEGVDGVGIGECVIAHVDIKRKLKIWIGYGKSKNLFHANCRPKKIKVSLLISHNMASLMNGFVYNDIEVIHQQIIQLNDINGYQELLINLPDNELLKNVNESLNYPPTTLIAIQILSVYEGSKYQDTLISEIQNE
jgi:hypothetical protein